VKSAPHSQARHAEPSESMAVHSADSTHSGSALHTPVQISILAHRCVTNMTRSVYSKRSECTPLDDTLHIPVKHLLRVLVGHGHHLRKVDQRDLRVMVHVLSYRVFYHGACSVMVRVLS